MRNTWMKGIVAGLVLGGMVIGCARDKRPVTKVKSEQFVAKAATDGHSTSGNKEIKSGHSSSGATTPEPSARDVVAQKGNETVVAGNDPVLGARNVAQGTGEVARPEAPGTKPTTRPLPGISTGSYMIVGAVVAEANGQPIYADKVLSQIDVNLSARAKELPPQQFRAFAESEIRSQIRASIYEELEFAAAQRNLTEEEQQIAMAVTTMYRQREITKAGGSIAVTRANMRKGGLDFDEQVQHEYRRNMVRLYYSRKVWPRVQISADDMREFYDRSLESVFTERAEVLFRVIQIAKGSNPETSYETAKKVHNAARNGNDFGALSAKHTSDLGWARNRGYMSMVDVKKPKLDENGLEARDASGNPILETVMDENGKPAKAPVWFPKGSLAERLAPLEEAAFKTPEGEMSDILDIGDAYYIVKVEGKKAGGVQAFEDPRTQERIRTALETRQRQELRTKEQMKLLKNAVSRVDDRMVGTCLEMAMQKYAAWQRASVE